MRCNQDDLIWVDCDRLWQWRIELAKLEANTDTEQASFRMLNKLIKTDATEKRKKINSIKEWSRPI